MKRNGVEILKRGLYTPPLMSFDIVATFRQRLGENYKLHAKFINPAWAKVTQLIGYDKTWAKAEGCYLWDTDGQRTLDCVSGFCSQEKKCAVKLVTESGNCKDFGG